MKDKKIKIQDYWLPVKPPIQIMRRLVNQNIYPQIEMQMVEDGVDATVTFPFFFRGAAHVGFIDANYKRIIKGPSRGVYQRAARAASKIGLSDERNFNTEWNRTLLNLLNKPSENKTMINLGVYKPKEESGLYNIKSTGELLRDKILSKNITNISRLAKDAGINESTVHRHLAGYVEITRDVAFKYAKVLGCDPSELLFNSLDIPVWGKTATQDLTGQGDYSVLPGEIIGFQKEEYISCPREIYRPDCKAIRIDQENSIYHNHIAYYYNSNEPVVLEGQMVVVGVQVQNSRDKDKRFRYFFGEYRKNRNNKTVDIINIDPEVTNFSEVEQDEDCNSFDDLKYLIEGSRYVIEDIKPEFVAAVVALVNPNNIKNKEDYIRDHSRFYNMARRTDIFAKDEFKKLLLKNYIVQKEKEKIEDDIDSGTLKYSLTEREIEALAREKAEQIYLRSRDTIFSEIAQKIGSKLRKPLNIKTLKEEPKEGVKAIDEKLSKEEIDRINAIDDHINEVLAGQDSMENKSA